MNAFRTRIAAAALVAGTAATGVAPAAFVGPGQTVTLGLTEVYDTTAADLVATKDVVLATDYSPDAGRLRATVYRNADGTLTFFYEHVSFTFPHTPQPLNQIELEVQTVGGWGGFSSDVLLSSSDSRDSIASRTADGGTISFVPTEYEYGAWHFAVSTDAVAYGEVPLTARYRGDPGNVIVLADAKVFGPASPAAVPLPPMVVPGMAVMAAGAVVAHRRGRNA